MDVVRHDTLPDFGREALPHGFGRRGIRQSPSGGDGTNPLHVGQRHGQSRRAFLTGRKNQPQSLKLLVGTITLADVEIHISYQIVRSQRIGNRQTDIGQASDIQNAIARQLADLRQNQPTRHLHQLMRAVLAHGKDIFTGPEPVATDFGPRGFTVCTATDVNTERPGFPRIRQRQFYVVPPPISRQAINPHQLGNDSLHVVSLCNDGQVSVESSTMVDEVGNESMVVLEVEVAQPSERGPRNGTDGGGNQPGGHDLPKSKPFATASAYALGVRIECGNVEIAVARAAPAPIDMHHAVAVIAVDNEGMATAIHIITAIIKRMPGRKFAVDQLHPLL